MATSKRIIYWDSCVFVAFLTAEKREEGELANVRAVIADVEQRKVTLITSSKIHSEVYRLPKKGKTQLLKLFDRSNVKCLDATSRVMLKAGELRGYYDKRRKQNADKTLGEPDSVHLATAILYKADEFHTFDKKGRKGTLGLLPLNGNVAGHQLTICKPRSVQGMLDLDA